MPLPGRGQSDAGVAAAQPRGRGGLQCRLLHQVGGGGDAGAGGEGVEELEGESVETVIGILFIE